MLIVGNNILRICSNRTVYKLIAININCNQSKMDIGFLIISYA